MTPGTRRSPHPPSQPRPSFLRHLIRGVDATLTAADGSFPALAAALIIADMAMAVVVSRAVPYTEIDWAAYMEQVRTAAAGERNYRAIRGGTGPLVYPAVFLYVYAALAALPSAAAVGVAFAVLHAATVGLYVAAYRRAYVALAIGASGGGQLKGGVANGPSHSLSPATTARAALVSLLLPCVLLPLSRRVLSLYVLRFFNDGVEAAVAAAALLLFSYNAWTAGTLVYSLAVGIKMNALLLAPALAVLLFQARGPLGGTALVGLAGVVQLVVGAPFLAAGRAEAVAYVAKAFELDRAFLQKWSVNGAAYSAETFSSATLSRSLLGVHLGLLLAFGHTHWAAASGGLPGLIGFDRLLGGGSGSGGGGGGGSGGGGVHPRMAAAATTAVDSPVTPAATRGVAATQPPLPIPSAATTTTSTTTTATATATSAATSAATSPTTPTLSPSGWWAWATAYPPRRLTPAHTLRTLLTANLIGVAAARTLHYQFYAWYWHSLPWLAVVAAGAPTSKPAGLGGGAAWAAAVAAHLGVVAVIEVVFNIYPPRPIAAVALHAAHAVLLLGLWHAPSPAVWEDEEERGDALKRL
ncbi:hypothetical protein MMPV_004609 [Pyropia vietnamensis]